MDDEPPLNSSFNSVEVVEMVETEVTEDLTPKDKLALQSRDLRTVHNSGQGRTPQRNRAISKTKYQTKKKKKQAADVSPPTTSTSTGAPLLKIGEMQIKLENVEVSDSQNSPAPKIEESETTREPVTHVSPSSAGCLRSLVGERSLTDSFGNTPEIKQEKNDTGINTKYSNSDSERRTKRKSTRSKVKQSPQSQRLHRNIFQELIKPEAKEGEAIETEERNSGDVGTNASSYSYTPLSEESERDPANCIISTIWPTEETPGQADAAHCVISSDVISLAPLTQTQASDLAKSDISEVSSAQSASIVESAAVQDPTESSHGMAEATERETLTVLAVGKIPEVPPEQASCSFGAEPPLGESSGDSVVSITSAKASCTSSDGQPEPELEETETAAALKEAIMASLNCCVKVSALGTQLTDGASQWRKDGAVWRLVSPGIAPGDATLSDTACDTIRLVSPGDATLSDTACHTIRLVSPGIVPGDATLSDTACHTIPRTALPAGSATGPNSPDGRTEFPSSSTACRKSPKKTQEKSAKRDASVALPSPSPSHLQSGGGSLKSKLLKDLEDVMSPDSGTIPFHSPPDVINSYALASEARAEHNFLDEVLPGIQTSGSLGLSSRLNSDWLAEVTEANKGGDGSEDDMDVLSLYDYDDFLESEADADEWSYVLPRSKRMVTASLPPTKSRSRESSLTLTEEKLRTSFPGATSTKFHLGSSTGNTGNTSAVQEKGSSCRYTAEKMECQAVDVTQPKDSSSNTGAVKPKETVCSKDSSNKPLAVKPKETVRSKDNSNKPLAVKPKETLGSKDHGKGISKSAGRGLSSTVSAKKEDVTARPKDRSNTGAVKGKETLGSKERGMGISKSAGKDLSTKDLDKKEDTTARRASSPLSKTASIANRTKEPKSRWSDADGTVSQQTPQPSHKRKMTEHTTHESRGPEAADISRSDGSTAFRNPQPPDKNKRTEHRARESRGPEATERRQRPHTGDNRVKEHLAQERKVSERTEAGQRPQPIDRNTTQEHTAPERRGPQGTVFWQKPQLPVPNTTLLSKKPKLMDTNETKAQGSGRSPRGVNWQTAQFTEKQLENELRQHIEERDTTLVAATLGRLDKLKSVKVDRGVVLEAMHLLIRQGAVGGLMDSLAFVCNQGLFNEEVCNAYIRLGCAEGVKFRVQLTNIFQVLKRSSIHPAGDCMLALLRVLSGDSDNPKSFWLVLAYFGTLPGFVLPLPLVEGVVLRLLQQRDREALSRFNHWVLTCDAAALSDLDLAMVGRVAVVLQPACLQRLQRVIGEKEEDDPDEDQTESVISREKTLLLLPDNFSNADLHFFSQRIQTLARNRNLLGLAWLFAELSGKALGNRPLLTNYAQALLLQQDVVVAVETFLRYLHDVLQADTDPAESDPPALDTLALAHLAGQLLLETDRSGPSAQFTLTLLEVVQRSPLVPDNLLVNCGGVGLRMVSACLSATRPDKAVEVFKDLTLEDDAATWTGVVVEVLKQLVAAREVSLAVTVLRRVVRTAHRGVAADVCGLAIQLAWHALNAGNVKASLELLDLREELPPAPTPLPPLPVPLERAVLVACCQAGLGGRAQALFQSLRRRDVYNPRPLGHPLPHQPHLARLSSLLTPSETRLCLTHRLHQLYDLLCAKQAAGGKLDASDRGLALQVVGEHDPQLLSLPFLALAPRSAPQAVDVVVELLAGLDPPLTARCCPDSHLVLVHPPSLVRHLQHLDSSRLKRGLVWEDKAPRPSPPQQSQISTPARLSQNTATRQLSQNAKPAQLSQNATPTRLSQNATPAQLSRNATPPRQNAAPARLFQNATQPPTLNVPPPGFPSSGRPSHAPSSPQWSTPVSQRAEPVSQRAELVSQRAEPVSQRAEPVSQRAEQVSQRPQLTIVDWDGKETFASAASKLSGAQQAEGSGEALPPCNRESSAADRRHSFDTKGGGTLGVALSRPDAPYGQGRSPGLRPDNQRHPASASASADRRHSSDAAGGTLGAVPSGLGAPYSRGRSPSSRADAQGQSTSAGMKPRVWSNAGGGGGGGGGAPPPASLQRSPKSASQQAPHPAPTQPSAPAPGMIRRSSAAPSLPTQAARHAPAAGHFLLPPPPFQSQPERSYRASVGAGHFQPPLSFQTCPEGNRRDSAVAGHFQLPPSFQTGPEGNRRDSAATGHFKPPPSFQTGPEGNRRYPGAAEHSLPPPSFKSETEGNYRPIVATGQFLPPHSIKSESEGSRAISSTAGKAAAPTLFSSPPRLAQSQSAIKRPPGLTFGNSPQKRTRFSPPCPPPQLRPGPPPRAAQTGCSAQEQHLPKKARQPPWSGQAGGELSQDMESFSGQRFSPPHESFPTNTRTSHGKTWNRSSDREELPEDPFSSEQSFSPTHESFPRNTRPSQGKKSSWHRSTDGEEFSQDTGSFSGQGFSPPQKYLPTKARPSDDKQSAWDERCGRQEFSQGAKSSDAQRSSHPPFHSDDGQNHSTTSRRSWSSDREEFPDDARTSGGQKSSHSHLFFSNNPKPAQESGFQSEDSGWTSRHFRGSESDRSTQQESEFMENPTLHQYRGRDQGQVSSSLLGPIPNGGQIQIPNRGHSQRPSSGHNQGSSRGHSQRPSRGHNQGSSRGHSQRPSRGHNQGPSRGHSQRPSRGHGMGPSRSHSKGPSRGQIKRPSRGQGQGPSRGQGQGQKRGQVRGPSMNQSQRREAAGQPVHQRQQKPGSPGGQSRLEEAGGDGDSRRQNLAHWDTSLGRQENVEQISQDSFTGPSVEEARRYERKTGRFAQCEHQPHSLTSPGHAPDRLPSLLEGSTSQTAFRGHPAAKRPGRLERHSDQFAGQPQRQTSRESCSEAPPFRGQW